jgi:hypothetical protein
VRLAYADPPYPGKAHLYPEKTEVDHVELIARLSEYDGWALSTDETSLAYVLGLCPPKTRVLAWCRTTAPPLRPNPYAAWEPVLCQPARKHDCDLTRSFLVCPAVNGFGMKGRLIGRKPLEFCEWIVRCLGAKLGDTLDDLFPGANTMSHVFEATVSQPRLFIPDRQTDHRQREQMAARNHEPLFKMDTPRSKYQPHTQREDGP